MVPTLYLSPASSVRAVCLSPALASSLSPCASFGDEDVYTSPEAKVGFIQPLRRPSVPFCHEFVVDYLFIDVFLRFVCHSIVCDRSCLEPKIPGTTFYLEIMLVYFMDSILSQIYFLSSFLSAARAPWRFRVLRKGLQVHSPSLCTSMDVTFLPRLHQVRKGPSKPSFVTMKVNKSRTVLHGALGDDLILCIIFYFSFSFSVSFLFSFV